MFLCKYGQHGIRAQCGVLVVNFRLNRNKEGQERLSKFHSALKRLVKKQGAVIQTEDLDLGRMVLYYKDFSAEAMSSKKKQLEKHPAVHSVAYNSTVALDVVRD
ncbi:MAG: hypothetical protein OXJ52_02480 [Oligoflexia bacterium]|nr:hypothetical protein [Oligoflexia bacterium]